MTAVQPELRPQLVGDALRWAVQLLAARGADSPRLDAEVLLAHVLEVERPQVLVRRDECLTPAQIGRYAELVRRRVQHEPVAYLIGQRAFYDLTLEVSPDVLIPRPESEHLVEEALSWARERRGRLRVVDVGTGSGAIAIALARHLPEAVVWAVDISWAALQVARRNLLRYGLAQQAHLAQADLLAPLEGRFDLIVANLPYVDTDEMAALEPTVADYEPRLALNGGAGGAAVITRLVEQLSDRLACPGLALLEIDPRQGAPLQDLIRRRLPGAGARLIRDYGGRERVLRIERDKGESHASR